VNGPAELRQRNSVLSRPKARRFAAAAGSFESIVATDA